MCTVLTNLVVFTTTEPFIVEISQHRTEVINFTFGSLNCQLEEQTQCVISRVRHWSAEWQWLKATVILSSHIEINCSTSATTSTPQFKLPATGKFICNGILSTLALISSILSKKISRSEKDENTPKTLWMSFTQTPKRAKMEGKWKENRGFW